MKYKVRQGDARFSINIEGKHDFQTEAPIEVDKHSHLVRIIDNASDGTMKSVMIDHKIYRVSVTRRVDGFPDAVIIRGVSYPVDIDKIESTRFRPPPPPKQIPGDVYANMPGQVIGVVAAEGDTVEAGQLVVILEAMKMENEILAPKAGVLKKIARQEGDLVMKGDLLFEVE